MIRQNLHSHTCFDDGKNTPMEMAQAAYDAGFASFGFSFHSILPFPNDWCLTEETMPAYLAAAAEAKAAFSGKMTVFSGIEWDILSEQDTAGFDYVIGSVHHVSAGGGVFSVDESPEVARAAIERFCHGGAAALAEAYYASVRSLAELPFVDIVGHFDLITKFDEKHGLFDETAPRYRDAAMDALESLVKADKIFEVNTGAISRGWRTSPYPSVRFLRELLARRAHICVSADCHSTDAVACAFPETETLLRELGFRERWELTEHGFAAVAL